MPKHSYEILETPLGKFTVRTRDGSKPDYGPFDDLPAAVKGLKRLIYEPRTFYDDQGQKMEAKPDV